MGFPHTPTTSDRRGPKAMAVAGLLAALGAMVLGAWLIAVVRDDPPPAPLSLANTLSPVTPQPASAIVGPVLARSTPVSLRIPAIGVASQLIGLGKNKDGTVEVPAPGPNYNRAGWYRPSPTPGSLGPAVIIGHVDSATERRSVFFKLGSLKPGARVEVSRVDGITAIFEVDAIRRYNRNAFPTQLVYGNTNHAALRLITCGGPIDPKTGHYRDNVIVWASLVGPTPAPTPMLEP